ncbi:unnamed protein product [Oppiella nova]|uniref:C2H2-type domain-containing protein n=1 Tax=Oppiella nova TaxID=334625 RepID=A0A7R9QRN8_9ACAR|nr:unnamed protein product [Oppiella nova]CAG2171430.1 unnamed protein product [Oppiella nova]
MSESLVVENNRLIRDLMFAKKVIKSLENITTFAIQLTQEVDGDCNPVTVQRIRTDIDAHLKTYHSLRQQLTDTTPAKKTTEITRVCDDMSDEIDDNNGSINDTIDGHKITGICVGKGVKSVTKSDFYRYQRFLRPLMRTVSTNTTNQSTIDVSGVTSIQCNVCSHQVLTPEEMFAHQRQVHRIQRPDDCLLNYECSDRNCGFKCPELNTWLDHKHQHQRDGMVVFNKRQKYATQELIPVSAQRYTQMSTTGSDGRPTNELSLAIESISSASDGTVVLNAVPVRSTDQSMIVYPAITAPEVVYRTYELKNFNPLKCMHCSYGIKKDNQSNGIMRGHMSEQHPNHSSDFDKSLAAKEANNSYVFECIDCKHIVEDQDVLELHHSSVHCGQTYRLWCDLCSYSTGSYEEFTQHNNKHRTRVHKSINTTLSTVIVDQSVRSVDEPEEEVMDEESSSPVVTKTESKKYLCAQEGCHKAFKHEFLLIKHVRNYHKLIECDKCLERFKTIQLLNAHLLKAHKEYLIRCQSCDYQTFWPSFHERHVTRHHLTQWWNCSHKNCTERFLKEQSLEKHINKVHKRGFKPYECPDCQLEYYTNADLIRHLGRTHRQLVYECQECEFKCSDTGALTQHRNDKHVNHVYKCEATDCGFETRHSSVFSSHWNRVHSRRYSCTYAGCGRVFPSGALLDRHAAKHPFPHVCDVQNCGRDFVSFKALSLHKWSTHNVPIRERKQVCADCHRVFTTRKGFTHHRRTKHQKQTH